MNGAYILVLKLNSGKNIKVGALGKIKFKKGFYCYVGSAIGNTTIEKRCRRHLKKKKALRWHIDYLRKEAEIVEIFAIPSKRKKECKIAKKIWGKLIILFQNLVVAIVSVNLIYFISKTRSRFLNFLLFFQEEFEFIGKFDNVCLSLFYLFNNSPLF